MSVINVSKKVTRSGYEFFFDVSLLTHARHIMGLSPPRHGIIVVNPNGTITYLPGVGRDRYFLIQLLTIVAASQQHPQEL